MKKSIFILSIVHTSNEDTLALDTYAYGEIDKAKEELAKQESEWMDMHRSLKDDMSDDEFEDWIANSISEDLEHDKGTYKSYIYDNGDEKVFSIEKHEIDINTLFVLTKESLFTRNQFEIDHSIEIITEDFQKALSMAYKLKEEATTEMSECLKAEKLKGTDYEFVIIDPDNGDRIYIKLNAMEVK